MVQHVLVTGGNGFLAQHIILNLLNQGYLVRATLRDVSKANQVRQTMVANGAKITHLTFVQGDLSQDYRLVRGDAGNRLCVKCCLTSFHDGA